MLPSIVTFAVRKTRLSKFCYNWVWPKNRSDKHTFNYASLNYQFLIRSNKKTGTGSLFLIQIRIRKRDLVPYSDSKKELKFLYRFHTHIINHCWSYLPLVHNNGFYLETVRRKQTINYISLYMSVPYSLD
jgi:hypothetical protein